MEAAGIQLVPPFHENAEPGTIPLQGYEKFRSGDADETRSFVSSIFCPHRLEPKTRNGKVDALVNHAPVGGISLNYLRYGVPVMVDPGELGRLFLVQIQLSGGVDVKCGQQQETLGAGHASVLSPTEYTRMSWTGDAAELIVRLERDAMENCLGALLGASLPRPLVFDLAMNCREGATASWCRTVRFLQSELEAPDSVLMSPLAVKQFEQALIYSLLYSQPHNYSDALEHGLSPAAPRHVKLVEDYIHANADEPISIEDLATVAGVSARTLFTGFQKFRGTSPMKYLRQVRMERAHHDLEHAEPGARVTDVALRWGFSQLGRFAVEYRKAFGESPSDTLKRLPLS